MNIEESNLYNALDRYSKYYTSIHLSDNNRFFPGFGAIDFSAIFDHLKKSGFTGRLAIEGNLKNDFNSDIRKSVEYLKSVIS
jgi:sugar phosphate isomerase/epimerase